MHLTRHCSRVAALLAALAPAGLAAQAGAAKPETPPAVKPPPGMCRVWVDGVPADKQPAPTDCATAVKNKPANGRVVFGEASTATRSTSAPPMSRSLSMPTVPRARASRDTGEVRDSTKRAPAKIKRDSSGKKPPLF